MNIIAFAGRKNSGKSTLCNFLHGYYMKMHGSIDGFEILENGDLVIETDIIGDDGQLSKGKGVIDIKRTDVDFAMWASSTMWPIVKHYAFATPFKEFAVELFDIDRNKVYGSNEDKNSLTQYKWEDMPFKTKKTGYMTVREFLQSLGTEIFRKIYSDIWANRALKDIVAENPMMATISDLRHQNECLKVKANGGKIIFLTGGLEGDSHSSETSFEEMEFDATIDTANQSVDESCHQLVELCNQWGFVPSEIFHPQPENAKPKKVRKIR